MVSLSADVFRLQRDLRAFRSFADSRSDELLRGFDRGSGETVTPLALEAFERLRRAANALSELPVTEEDEALSESATARCARLAAIAVHAHVATRYQAGRGAVPAVPASRILRAISTAEAGYNASLLDARTSAKGGRIARLADALNTCLDLAEGELGYAALALAGQDDAVKSDAIAGPRLGEITRRVAMLSGACLQLMFRLTNTRKAAGLRSVAANRTALDRSSALLMAAVPAPTGLSNGDTVRLRAKVADIEFVEDGDGFTRIGVDAGDVVELRLPRRNAMRAGVVTGSWLALEGTVSSDAGNKILGIGQQPISTHAADVWEDYLITEMRPVYDMRPGSIDMAWELPDLGVVGGRNELHGRL